VNARKGVTSANERDAEREAKRQCSAMVGTGVLHSEIAVAAAEAGIPITDLIVLSKGKDPYFRDTREGHENGQWFAGQVARFVAHDKKIHIRGLFYLIVSAADTKLPDGTAFINGLDCWLWLQNKAAKSARALGYVPFSRIRDARNEAPRLISYMRSPGPGEGWLTTGLNIELPLAANFLPAPAGTSPIARQPYRVVLIGEKSSLAEVLEPIAREVEGELLLPTGEMSDTMIAEMAARAAADPRPAVVLYISDFDPSGHQMPISLARKLQAQRTLHHPDLRIEVHRVALTHHQVRELELPSTPLKVGEKRAKKWREKMGHEQVEVDALAALKPGELRRIVRNALEPFFDFSLAVRCQEALTEWRSEAWKRLAANPALTSVEGAILSAFKAVEKAERTLAKAQRDGLQKLSEGENGISTTEIAVPEVQIEAKPPPPLFSTSDDFVTATRKLIASKALEGGDDDEDGEA
jgi:hypothetical protein